METFLISIVVGVGIGVLSGLLGIGGEHGYGAYLPSGVFHGGYPSHGYLAVHHHPHIACGCITHIRNRTCIVPMGLAAGISGAFLSPLGVYLASISPSWAIMLAAAIIIGYSAITMLRKGLAAKKPVPPLEVSEKASQPARVDAPAAVDRVMHPTHRQLVVGIVAGVIAGVASGYVGVGGGFIMVPLFIALGAIPMKKASGTSLIAVTILAVPGVVMQAMMGNVMFAAGIAMAIRSIPGALFGANLVKRIPERALRLIFGAVLLCTAVVLAVNEFLMPTL